MSDSDVRRGAAIAGAVRRDRAARRRRRTGRLRGRSQLRQARDAGGRQRSPRPSDAAYGTDEAQADVLDAVRRSDARPAGRSRRWSPTTTCASRSVIWSRHARCAREAQFDLAPTVTAAGGYTKRALPAGGQPAPAHRSMHALLRRRLRCLLGARPVRPRAPQRRSAERGGRRAPQATLRDAQVSVTAEVARTYFELRGQQSELVGRTPQRRQPEGDPGPHPGAARCRQRHRAGHLARAVAAVGDAGHHRPARGRHCALHPSPERAHRARPERARRAAAARARAARAAAHDRRSATRRACCAAGPTSASPSASWPPPPRWSAWPSATSSPRSPSPAASATPPRSSAPWVSPRAAAT